MFRKLLAFIGYTIVQSNIFHLISILIINTRCDYLPHHLLTSARCNWLARHDLTGISHAAKQLSRLKVPKSQNKLDFR